MDSLDLCNAIRMEFGGILEDKIPLNALHKSSESIRIGCFF